MSTTKANQKPARGKTTPASNAGSFTTYAHGAPDVDLTLGDQPESGAAGAGGPALPEDARTFVMPPDPTDPHFPGRAPVTYRSWSHPDPTYRPNHYVTPKIAARIGIEGAKNVDPTWHREWESETQWADGDTPRLDATGMPLNPAGRTGLTGLGGCKRLGENKAADPVVTRNHPATGKLQVLLGFKPTEQQWALPGGTVDEGEDPAEACSRELLEEVGLSVDMSRGAIVYQGYVDDHRNTDNAWFSTQARHVHLHGEQADQDPQASDDISAAKWVDLDSLDSQDLFAGHGGILAAAGLLDGNARAAEQAS